MTALTKLACALVLAGGLGAPAFAATTGTPSPGSAAEPNAANSQNAMSNDQNGPAAGQNAMHIGQRLRADLTRAGYTDITVLPSSFMVHAKDSQGNPVMMVVSPDSVTAITEENARANSASNSTHAGANNSEGSTTGSAQSAAPTKP